MKKKLQATSYRLQANNFGFTLVELLVSLSIIIMMTTLFLANYHSSNERSKLSSASQQMASDIRLAQSYALGSKKFNGAIPPGGWGVYFNETNTSYIIFADNDGGKDYDDPGEKFSEIDLPANVTISSIDVANDVDIVFLPPDPEVFFNGLTAPAVNSVQIELSDGETVKTVEVNYLGLVDAID
jgi:Tfp pilus assembly protein FimT